MSSQKETHKYDDIIDLPHHVSAKRAPMSRIDRGAQFSPFAALTGYDAAIRETARLTDDRVELSEGVREMLDKKIRALAALCGREPEATIEYFRPDERKLGGAYVSVTGPVRKVDAHRQIIVLRDGTMVPFADITEIHSPQLKEE